MHNVTPTSRAMSAGKKGVAARAATIAPRRRGPQPKAVVEHPEPLTVEWVEPDTLGAALRLHADRHDDSLWHLHKAITKQGETLDRKTLQCWASGTKVPGTSFGLEVLGRIEHRYRLPAGYFRAKLGQGTRAVRGITPGDLTPAERRKLAWHLPDDFDKRPQSEREEILAWVRDVIVAGTTAYRRFQADAIKQRYALRFPPIADMISGRRLSPKMGERAAPEPLVRDLAALLWFKSKTLTAIGEQRSGVWGEETAAQKLEHLALMFGAMVADPDSEVRGLGVPSADLSLALLVVPAIWDWYLQWREARRGFYTAWEVNMLELVRGLSRPQTGWLWQNPELAEQLLPIEGLLSAHDIDRIRQDWPAACAAVYAHALARTKEIGRVVRVHRDPFEPILTVLEDNSPVAAYRRICTEILQHMPSADRYPRAAAEAVRAFLMLRLGLHLGVRQKNLRQLLVCKRGSAPRSERQLEMLKRGEMRWSERDNGWEVLIPSVAFKNANSSFFGSKPFRLLLPDLDGLYEHIAAYLAKHRSLLLAGAEDPGTFFVKSVKRNSSDAAYDQTTFYEAWRLITQRYGVYNPYTGRGAIKGLLPHGPHNVRDVLATHILKRTGSYEQASYAIQDTPEMVAQHYGRFLPQDKSALAAQILNEVWAF